MNWLGEMVQDRILSTSDTVLDIGCGEANATGKLNTVHVGVDCFEPWLKKAQEKGLVPLLLDMEHHETIQHTFLDRSFDVVLLLDVVEHLEKSRAIELIRRMLWVARKKVFIFTPKGFKPQNCDINRHNVHKCGFEPRELGELGFSCMVVPNGSNGECIFGVYEVPNE